MKTLRNVSHVELIGIPVLQACVLPTAFKCVVDVKMENASLLEEIEELSEVRRKQEEEERRQEEERRKREEEEERKRRAAEEERLRKEREEAAAMARRRVVINCKRNWDRVDYRVVESIKVSDGCCNEKGLKELDLRGFVNLRELKVGNECFENVKEVKLIRLIRLESVEIGMNSFTKKKNSVGNNPNRHFFLRDCPKLKSLKIGSHSFSDYTLCEIENVNSLESIEMYYLDAQSSFNFCCASLELKSILIHSE